MRMTVLALAGVLATASGLSSTDQHPGPVRDTSVSIRTFQFRPAVLVIPLGSRVTWTNGDEIEHTVTAGVPDSAPGPLNGSLANRGATFAQTFARTGTYSYFCDRHRFMRGEIRVTSTGEN